MSQSSVVAKALFLAASELSPGSGTMTTRRSHRKQARTATNSTWANFAPGQFCGPSDQGKYVLCTGVMSSSWCSRVAKFNLDPLEPGAVGAEIHREGCQRRGSGQYLGCVCTASRLGVTPVCDGTIISLPPIWSLCGRSLLHLGSAIIGG